MYCGARWAMQRTAALQRMHLPNRMRPRIAAGGVFSGGLGGHPSSAFRHGPSTLSLDVGSWVMPKARNTIYNLPLLEHTNQT
jgi:hypothetical protein